MDHFFQWIASGLFFLLAFSSTRLASLPVWTQHEYPRLDYILPFLDSDLAQILVGFFVSSLHGAGGWVLFLAGKRRQTGMLIVEEEEEEEKEQ